MDTYSVSNGKDCHFTLIKHYLIVIMDKFDLTIVWTLIFWGINIGKTSIKQFPCLKFETEPLE